MRRLPGSKEKQGETIVVAAAMERLTLALFVEEGDQLSVEVQSEDKMYEAVGAALGLQQGACITLRFAGETLPDDGCSFLDYGLEDGAKILVELPGELQVLKAWFGAPDYIASATYGCDVTAKVQSMVKDNELHLDARGQYHYYNNLFGGDPAPNKPKVLSVEYTYGGEDMADTIVSDTVRNEMFTVDITPNGAVARLFTKDQMRSK